MTLERLGIREGQHPFRVRWKWLVALTALGGSVAFAATWTSVPIYRVRTQLVLFPQSDQQSLSALLLSGTTPTPLSILHGVFDSDALRGDVQKQFGLSAAAMDRMWFVQSDAASNQLEIIVDAPRQDLARDIARFSVTRARQLELQAGQTAASLRSTQLAEALNSQQSRMSQAERAFTEVVADLKSPVGGVGDAESVAARLSGLEAQLAAERAKFSALRRQANLNLDQAELPKEGPLDSLRQTVRRLEEDVKVASERFGPEAPELKSLESRLEVAKVQYARELDRAKLALRSNLQADASAALSRMRSLEVQVEALRQADRSAPADAARVHSAVRQLRQVYTTTTDLRARYEQARIEAEVERVNWTVVTDAFAEERPINKRFVRNPMAGAALGFVLGAVLCFLVPLSPRRPSKRAQSLEEPKWPNAA